MSWEIAQKHEKEWWGNCQNTFGEEMKQFVYAPLMGISTMTYHDSPYNFQSQGKILDIGGGPASMLLKTPGVQGVVVDPCDFPQWVKDRYQQAGITLLQQAAESYIPLPENKGYDEVWIYNCLQHVIDPSFIIKNAKMLGKCIRIFEWIDYPTNEMHPHILTEDNLLQWLKPDDNNATDKTSSYGVKTIDEVGAVGKCFFGTFYYR